MNEINLRPANKTCVFYGFLKLQVGGETEFGIRYPIYKYEKYKLWKNGLI